MAQEKPSSRKVRPARNRSTASEAPPSEPQVDPYEAASKQLTDLDERVRKIEEMLATALGISL